MNCRFALLNVPKNSIMWEHDVVTEEPPDHPAVDINTNGIANFFWLVKSAGAMSRHTETARRRRNRAAGDQRDVDVRRRPRPEP
jgi:hypothetical protein